MAYDKKEIYELAIKEINKHNLFFISDLLSLLPISKPTFYSYFPIDSNEFNNIKRLINENKVKTKVAIRAKLFKGKGVELIALYKLLATKEELQALSGNFHMIEQKNITRNIDITEEEAKEISKKFDDMF